MLNATIIILLCIWGIAALPILIDLLWDLAFLQRREYRIERIISTIKWDFEPSHRHPVKTLFKVIAFLLLASFAFFPTSALPVAGLLLVISLWCNEFFAFWQNVFYRRLPKLQLDAQTTAILILAIISFLFIPFTLLTAVRVGDTPLRAVFTDITSVNIADLLPTQGESAVLVPSLYIMLIFSGLLGIAFDLAVPLIALILATITTPINWLRTLLLFFVAKAKLARNPDLFVIVVTGSTGKSTVKNILYHLLRDKFHVAKNHDMDTNLTGVCRTIIYNLKRQTKYLIIEVHSYKAGDIKQIGKLIRPNLAVITNIDESHIGMFGSLSATLQAKAEVLDILASNGTAVLNVDDKFVSELTRRGRHQEVLYSTSIERRDDFLSNELTADILVAQDLAKHENGSSFNLLTNSEQVQITTETKLNKESIHPVLAAIAAAETVGMEWGEIVTRMQTAPLKSTEILTGDMGSQILLYPQRLRYRSFLTALDQLAEMPAKQKVLITAGISELGSYKNDVYHTLAKHIQAHCDVLITTDPKLASHTRKNNTRTQVITTSSIESITHHARKFMTSDSLLCLLGEMDEQIAARLRTEKL